MKAEAPISGLHVSVLRIPTDEPEADGTLEWDATTMVLAEAIAAGATGIGYSYASAAAGHFIADKLRPVIVGLDAFDIPLAHATMLRAVRNDGRPGVASAAVSAVDVALWDLKAKLLDVSLTRLLGRVHERVAVYGSGGFTSYDDARLADQLGNWAAQGMRAVKMKVGAESLERDVERVQHAQRAIGTDCALFVDANGACDRDEALLAATRYAAEGVTWFEEPVSSDDLEGLRGLRRRAPAGLAIAAGEYGYDIWYFRRMLAAEAVDVLQADATRCGGITGFLRAAELARAFHVPLSSHTAPALHLAPCCAILDLRPVEWFHDHERIESLVFDGAPQPRSGYLSPDATRPGLGLDLKRRDAAEWQTFSS